MAAVETRECETEGCNSEAKLQCPTCIKLGIQGSYFCSQECFKGSWSTHKLLHKKTNVVKNCVEDDTNTDPWPGYRYTGKLRPFYPLTPKRPVPGNILRPDYADHPMADTEPAEVGLLAGMSESEQSMKGTSQIKTLPDDEIESMRTVCKLAREVLDIAAIMVKPGVTTEEIDEAVHLACTERNCYPSPLNYYNFPKSCCTSVNEVICHGIPDRRELQEGDILNVDITVFYNGYHGDLNETFFVGEVEEGVKRLVQTTYECLMQAIDAVKPGVRYRELGNIIQKHAQASGFSVVRSYCGHGIHKLFHTAPNVPHYAKNKAVGVMKPGHVFTIEPMICEGGWQDETWPDGWTAVTRDGKRSAQFEHTLLVTETGCDILTRRLEDNGRAHFLSFM
ncbi:methionine aminopeptidase 1 isoform X3 [Clupea harengus]|uniref:Methionine aminopeptidase n=1 Tax=Clupea harengus TaxID=7950 RepID=A0A6P8GLB6_CLUHA|nr:methionine aminopeptidase 1 isoform X3 [Clupea harengus]